MSHGNMSIESPRSPRSPNGGLSTKDRVAALAAAGIGGAALAKGADEVYDRHVDADGYGESSPTQRKISSPVQSVSSLKKNFEEDQMSPKERPRSAASRSSAGRLRSGASSPSSKLVRSKHQSRSIGGDDYVTPLEQPRSGLSREATPGTPQGETVDDWYERQHRLNDQYRDSMHTEDSFTGNPNRDSYQTNPYPEDERRYTMFTEDSEGDAVADEGAEQDVRLLGTNPEYVHTPHGAESAVASLMAPSTVSSQESATKTSYSDRMAAHLREMGKDSPPIYQGSTLSQTMPSRDRWTAIKSQARDMSGSPSKGSARGLDSPSREAPRRLQEMSSGEKEPVMSASGLPLADDPLPEIGHYDDSKSDVTTNPSIIHGPLGGDATGNDTWPYTPEPAQRELQEQDSRSLKSGHSKEKGILAGAAAGAGLGAASFGATQALKQPTVDDDYDDEDRMTPDVGRSREYVDRETTPTSPGAFRDEGYVTDAHARSAGTRTPRAEQQQYSKSGFDEYNRGLEAPNVRNDDPFVGGAAHTRNISGNSHGMASPIYDSATGKGKENIQSKDIVALMDHLTVRDAQRNARDTEILVTLVRSASEMRQSFDDMKKFILDQDAKIMQNADRGADRTANKVLGGPRPQPGSPHTPRQSEEDIQTKRKGVLRRALKGLTGGKSASDLAKVEGMLMEILNNVEDLKNQGTQSQPLASYTSDTLDTYERLRNMPDSGYEPEGQAGTSSTPSQSGHFSVTPRGEKQQFHSGYDGRRGSYNRVSTVLEGDEDELEPHESLVLDHQFENNERMITPTQEMPRQRGFSPSDTPPQPRGYFNGAPENDLTPRSAAKQRKHQSNSSSVFGVPKVSRWSKTTSSSVAPDPATLDSPNGGARYQKPLSEASPSGSAIDQYDDEDYELRDDDRLRSTQSLTREQQAAETRSLRSQASKVTRTPSPLIPSEASIKEQETYYEEDEPSPIQEDLDDEEDGFGDPKYHAHRNSLLLQHPQPRQGTTGRHQNTLESQAHDFDHDVGTNSDVSQRTVSDFDPAMWGSSGTAGLAKHRLSQLEPLSPVSMGSPPGYGTGRYGKEDPLVPQQKPPIPPKVKYEEPEPEEEEWEPTYSNSGFSRGGYYSSPFGSGHLLEPIEEVRYSLETDSGHVSPSLHSIL